MAICRGCGQLFTDGHDENMCELIAQIHSERQSAIEKEQGLLDEIDRLQRENSVLNARVSELELALGNSTADCKKKRALITVQEQDMLTMLHQALVVLKIKPSLICTLSELIHVDDYGAYAEVENTASEHDDCYHFAQDKATGNIYLSINNNCHDFGVVDYKSILAKQIVDGFKSLMSPKE